MGFKIFITSCLLACVSSLEPGYGVPGAPLIVSQPQPLLTSSVAAPLPLQVLNSQVPVGLPLTNPPVAASLPFAAPLPQPLPLTAGAPLPIAAPAPLHLSGAPLPLGSPAPLPTAAATFPIAGSPLPLSPSPLAQLAPLSVAPTPLAAPIPPVAPSSQFHAQDEFGQFSFGYENINSRKTETKDAFGVTRGSYEYVDANGVLQTVKYVSDPINGFRVAGTNIPVGPVAPQVPAIAPLVAPVPVKETPEVAAARAEHLAAHDKLNEKVETAVEVSERKKRSVVTPAPITVNSLPAPVLSHPSPLVPTPLASLARPIGSPVPLPFAAAPAPIAPLGPFASVGAAPLSIAPSSIPAPVAPLPLAASPLPLSPSPLAQLAPLSVAPTPLAAPIPPVAPSSQFHAQDEFGQFSFGYENINSRKTETKDAFGVTRGSYEYVDANGVLQTVKYVSDPINGFRVVGTNIPVGPVAPNVALPVAPQVPVPAPLIAPVPVMDTPEVAAAKAKHLEAVAAAKKDAPKKEEETTKAEEL